MLEFVRRTAIIALWLLVALQVLGAACVAPKPRRARQLRPKGAEIRYIQPLGRRLVAIRVQVILA